jgi:hypothetical protein
VKFVVTLGIQGITTILPRRMWCSWRATTMVIVHKEVKCGINALIIKEVTKVILLILTSLPWLILFLGKLRSMIVSTRS